MAEKSQLSVTEENGVGIGGFENATVLDAYHVDQVSLDLLALVEKEKRRHLILDLGTIQMLSSQTLGVFLKLREKVEAQEGRVVICGVDPNLYRVFKITRLQSLFEFYDDRESALKSFAGI